MNAYDGTMHFYVADPDDPIIRAYEGIFPTMFEPLAAMPSDLRAHLRVPEELFNVQTRTFGRYHVTDPLQFFRKDDLWTVPTGTSSEQTLPSEAYYVEMHLPGEKGVEFLLLQPMVPTSRPNMIAWVAARNDGANYGSTLVYRFPADTTIFGPAQIEARIDQDPVISAQISLWNQSGSKVIRGNLIVLPLDDALIYLQPIYLQSTGSAFPAFTRIVVASPRQVVWSATLGDALRLLLAAEAGAPPQPTPPPSPGPSASPGPGATPTAGPVGTPSPTPVAGLPTDVPGLIDYANTHYELAQQALRDGDLARYGEEIALVGAAIQQLQVLAPGLALPSVGPSRQPRPVNRGVALIGALLVTLATPATWPLALGAFLLRGGILLVVVPVVVMPTPVGLANAFGPLVTAIALGSVTGSMIAAGGAAVLAVVALLFGGAWLAAALEAETIRIVALDEDLAARRPGRELSARRGVALRILVARLVALVPLLVAFAWGSVRLVSVAYRELTSPFDVVTPIAIRVLRETPEVIAAVVVAWMIGEIVGAMAARRIVLDGDGVGRALAGAIGTGVRHPVATLARFWAPALVLLAVLVPAAFAAGDRLDRRSQRARGGRRSRLGLGRGPGPGGPVDRRLAAPERGLCLASGRLDRRRGHPGRDVRGVDR